MTRQDAWMPADGLTLEKNALLAVMEPHRSLALTAGPGAGKTEILAQRADFLLRTALCPYPKRVLAISFKVDASQNLKDRVLKRCGSDLASRFDSYTFHGFAKRIIDRFRPVLEGADALDANYKIGSEHIEHSQITFAQLIPLATKILSASSIARNAVCQTYSDVFLDEFQDCTTEQYRLLRLVFMNKPIRLTAVGDVKQKIMGWAGAMDGIFADYANEFNAVPLHLFRNFRSKPALLRMQNEIIRALDPAAVMAGELIAGEEGDIWARNFENSQLEASYIADLVYKWHTVDLIPLREIAILFSKQVNDYGALIMQHLDAKGIPYRNEYESQDLVNEPVARLIVDYLSCLYRSRQPKCWTRLIERLTVIDDENADLKAQDKFEKMYSKHLKHVRARACSENPYLGWWEIVQEFMDQVGLPMLTTLSADYEQRSRLNEVIVQVNQQLTAHFERGSDLLAALNNFSSDETIRLLTIHKSKGLEFHSVIMPAIETQTFWGKAYDERCAFFVGVSRAKDRLMITSCDRRFRPLGNPPRWQERRSPHGEFISYITPFLSKNA
ncbi:MULTISPECIES: ATP-dependent helicase [Pseudomonas]|uniref:ATP-dependent helicase n=1 Tax=Pseudomonas TaxID=286 RepID=UPI000F7AEF1C|nr:MULTISPECIES: ATP-dependent helicase [Pseudomonas]MBW5414763.1 AAA family ATPase [Pseudomonas sp. MAG002Y]RRW40720.1 ATP-dependent helicase [Pseudomonas luteola]